MSQTFTHSLPVTFADCDAAGIMFYPRLFEMVNRIVELWFAGPLGRSFKTLHLDQHLSVPTARFEVNFIGANRLEDVLDISLSLSRIGRTSAGLEIAFRCRKDLRVMVSQTIVLVDGATLAPTPWPDDLKARMAPFLAAA